jgi:hypothetical protein
MDNRREWKRCHQRQAFKTKVPNLSPPGASAGGVTSYRTARKWVVERIIFDLVLLLFDSPVCSPEAEEEEGWNTKKKRRYKRANCS